MIYIYIQHTQKQYYDVDGNLRYSGTGYWIADLDMNSPHSVEAVVPEIGAVMSTIKDCEKELYCGLPYFMPVTTFLWYFLLYSTLYYLKKKFF